MARISDGGGAFLSLYTATNWSSVICIEWNEADKVNQVKNTAFYM